MKNNLAITSQALEAACRLNLSLIDNGYGADTISGFTQLFEDFCVIFQEFPKYSVQDSIEFWETHQNEYGELQFG